MNKPRPLGLSSEAQVILLDKILAGCARNDDGCLVWQGGKRNLGYGAVCLPKLISKKKRTVSTHRSVWEIENGEIPDGYVIDHICGNASCCEIKHLRAVTIQQNSQYKTVQHSGNKSGHRNVNWCPTHKKWRVRLCVSEAGRQKRIHVGYFDDVERAGEAAAAARKEYYESNEYCDWREVVYGKAA